MLKTTHSIITPPLVVVVIASDHRRYGLEDDIYLEKENPQKIPNSPIEHPNYHIFPSKKTKLLFAFRIVTISQQANYFEASFIESVGGHARRHVAPLVFIACWVVVVPTLHRY